MITAIQVRDVSKTYASGAAAVQALDCVSVEANFGELLMLTGPSGSGKTTLISIMGCILRPNSGKVQVCGTEVTGLPEKAMPAIRLNHIGFIFQGFNLFPALRAVENVELALDLKGIRGRAARSRALDLLDQVGLKEKASTYPSDLSGGQKQRVAIARALAGEPDVILADEPTAALDWNSGRTVIELLHGLAHQRKRAVVCVTHDGRTMGYADRIVRIEDGRISDEVRKGEVVPA